jgi:hypothetical protein
MPRLPLVCLAIPNESADECRRATLCDMCAFCGTRRWRHVIFAVALVITSAPSTGAEPVTLELVFAVDASSSINYREFRLQMLGLADAFRHPGVIRAISAAAPEGIAVTLVQWSGAGRQAHVIRWNKVSDAASALGMASRIEQAPRAITGGATAIGSALGYSIGLLETNGFQGKRRAIDISGDGRANQGQHPATMRARAVAAGMTVNGLAILNEEPDLDAYYIASVVGGPGAFLLTADRFEDFAEAIVAKLITEITGAPIALSPSVPKNAAQESCKTRY